MWGVGKLGQREWQVHLYTTKGKTDIWWEADAKHREINSLLCDNLEVWDREGERKGDSRGKRSGDICICIAN